MEPIDLPGYEGEWIEWTEEELDRVPEETWVLQCSGIPNMKEPPLPYFTMAAEKLLGIDNPADRRMQVDNGREWHRRVSPVIRRLRDEWLRANRQPLSREHKPLQLAKISQDRHGQIRISPRSEAAMQIDGDRRTVSFACGYRLDADHSKRCTYKQTLDLDKLLVILTQMHDRCETLAPGFSKWTDDAEVRPMRYAKRIVDLWEMVTMEFQRNQHEDNWEDVQEATKLFVDEYRRRRQPELVTNRKGEVIMTLV